MKINPHCQLACEQSLGFDVIQGAVLVGLLAVAFDLAFEKLEWRLARWQTAT